MNYMMVCNLDLLKVTIIIFSRAHHILYLLQLRYFNRYLQFCCCDGTLIKEERCSHNLLSWSSFPLHLQQPPSTHSSCIDFMWQKHQTGQKQWKSEKWKGKRRAQPALREQSKQQNPAPVLFLKMWMFPTPVNLPLSPLYLSISFFWQCYF